jgi:hypothetical protein
LKSVRNSSVLKRLNVLSAEQAHLTSSSQPLAQIIWLKMGIIKATATRFNFSHYKITLEENVIL